jgi:hypothetical protein
MRTWIAGIAMTVSVGLLAPTSGHPSQGTSGFSFSPQDRAEIELLSARHALALGTYAAATYAGLFASPDGSK